MNTKVTHPAFALRMEQACDGSAVVPSNYSGRLKWFVEQLETRFAISVTTETVRKWLHGETLPRHKSMRAMAEIMGVDVAWLSLGVQPALTTKEAKARNAMADGAVNVVAGLITMCGGTVAFPLENDSRARDARIDIYATIKGARYDIHVSPGDDMGGYWEFAIPVEAAPTLVIGVVRVDDLTCHFYEMEFENIVAIGQRKASIFEVSMLKRADSSPWRRITTFRDRL